MLIDNRYIELLALKRDRTPIKIPKQILRDIIVDRSNYKAIEIYLDLKPIFYEGRFKKAKTRYKEIAYFLGISISKYYRLIRQLKKLGLIKFNKKGDLILSSWRTLFELYGYKFEDSRSYKFYRLKNTIHLRLVLKQLLIEENFIKQKKIIYIKIYRSYILWERQKPIIEKINKVLIRKDIATKDRQRIIDVLNLEIRSIQLNYKNVERSPDFKKMKKNGTLDKLYIQGEKIFYSQLKKFNLIPDVNFDVSISCKKLAQLFGLSSPSSGSYWEQFFTWNKQAEIIKRSIFIPANKIGSALSYYSSEDLNFHYYKGRNKGRDKGIFRRLNNHIKFNPLVRA